MSSIHLFMLRNAIKTASCRHNLVLLRNNRNTGVRCNSLSASVVKPTRTMESAARDELLQIFANAVASVLPGALIDARVQLVDDALVVDGTTYPVGTSVYLVGFGKAVAGMAHSLEGLLGDRLKRGIVSVPRFSLRSQARAGPTSKFV